ncbi:MAG: nucleotidyltransferase family protein [Methyloversatilis sp.]|uniref:nucleotidyltransferase family protein n=1 Tax=Methyloversatilis sp. TaxID=2569862 RepID=UPI0027343BF8|nr:nucleotidyltransferase family protein [Methyloversatilis sp.]MDP3871347.1 nucleotidyltransferase family protein [Methyloversatilis sp.]
MKHWKKIVIKPDTSLRDAIACIDGSGLQLALALDEAGRLVGTLSDGDVRRAILRGCDLSAPVSEVMNRCPITAPEHASHAELLALMRRKVLHHVPMVNHEKQVVDLATLDTLTGVAELPNWVVLMAGGLGTRLRPLTESCPKPMLQVGGKPILESILESFAEQGFRKIFLSVNYLADAISDYFGNGSRHGVEIHYLHEDKRLGTAGALSLLPEQPNDPIVVMNGDLLTRVRFDHMLRFHEERDAAATMAVREYDFQVPYGVVRMDGADIVSIDEKPVHRFFVNAGIYTLSPEALSHVAGNTFFDMPTLFEKLLDSGRRTSAYPLREYWLDVGRLEELERAQSEWPHGGAAG